MLKDANGESAGEAALSIADEPGRRQLLACAGCRRVITSTAQRIEMNGSHEHVLKNPDGEQFQVGCFADASGLRCVGPTTLEFTWFAGYAWQSQVCASCRTFLGWLYRRGADRFHGLVLAALIEIDGG